MKQVLPSGRQVFNRRFCLPSALLMSSLGSGSGEVMRNFVLIGLSAATFLVGPAGAVAQTSSAPAQTVEGAQRFLQLTLPGLAYRPARLGTFLDEVQRVNRATIRGTARVTRANAVSRCVSLLNWDASDVYASRNGEITYLSESQPSMAANNETAGFNWGSDVMSARADGGNVFIRFRHNEKDSVLSTGSDSIAVRVAFAIEFLRSECDPAASTGF